MKCWYCGSDMEPKEDEHHHPYFQCPECGATWTKVPEPGSLPQKRVGFGATGHTSYVSWDK